MARLHRGARLPEARVTSTRAPRATDATRAFRALEDSLHGSRPPCVATTTAVKRDPPVRREPNYARRQRCPYVNTAVSIAGRFVSQLGRVVSQTDQRRDALRMEPECSVEVLTRAPGKIRAQPIDIEVALGLSAAGQERVRLTTFGARRKLVWQRGGPARAVRPAASRPAVQ